MAVLIPKYALVQWLSNEDKGKFSIVLSSWLKNFDYKQFLKNKDESYVVEWRDKKTPPLGGWTCFDAKVLQLSDSKASLDKKINGMVSLASPSVMKTSDDDKEPMYPQLLNLSGDDSDLDETFSPSPRAFKRADREENITPAKKRRPNKTDRVAICKNMFMENSLDSKDIEITKLREEKDLEISKLREENEYLKRRILKEIPAMMEKMEEVLKQSKNQKTMDEPSSDAGLGPEQHKQQRQPGKVEILPGTGVFVDLEAWLSAKGCNTPGGFVGRLLTNLFDKSTLLSSNLKGGKSKLHPQAEKKNKLDETKISALKGAMQTIFPDVKESQFGIFVNQKLTNLRMAERKLLNSPTT